ncbi:aminoglycoside phosphotransferase family protein [Streptomyces vietnamensis]
MRGRRLPLARGLWIRSWAVAGLRPPRCGQLFRRGGTGGHNGPAPCRRQRLLRLDPHHVGRRAVGAGQGTGGGGAARRAVPCAHPPPSSRLRSSRGDPLAPRDDCPHGGRRRAPPSTGAGARGAGRSPRRLLGHDAPTGTMLLERLDEARPLSTVADTREALRIVAGLLARLVAVPAPEGIRTLGGIAAGMLAEVPEAVARLGADDAAVLRDCAAAVREVAGEPGDRLLHWDLHFGNVLAGEREPWLAIDPKPLAGDPGFELLPALMDRFDPEGFLWGFDLLAEVVGDRGRAVAWTLGRVLQNGLWDVEDGEPALDAEQVAAARILLARRA